MLTFDQIFNLTKSRRLSWEEMLNLTPKTKVIVWYYSSAIKPIAASLLAEVGETKFDFPLSHFKAIHFRITTTEGVSNSLILTKNKLEIDYIVTLPPGEN